MTDVAFYASFLVTAISAVALYFRTKKRINTGVISIQLGKKRYLRVVLVLGVFSGLVIFPVLVSVFNYFGIPSFYGHDPALILAPVYNFLFALVIGFLGRVILNWEPMRW